MTEFAEPAAEQGSDDAIVHPVEVGADTEPAVFDTYALAYAFTAVFLVPGVLSLLNMPFRTYTVQYVSAVAVPFLLGLAAVFLSDSTEPVSTRLKRFVILTPLILGTAVAALFIGSLLIVPVSGFIRVENFGWLTWVAVAMLVLVALPLIPALLRRLRRPFTLTRIVQALFLLASMAIVGTVIYLTTQGVVTREFVRKDVEVYIVGAVTWYLPAVGMGAGIWRRLGLV